MPFCSSACGEYATPDPDTVAVVALLSSSDDDVASADVLFSDALAEEEALASVLDGAGVLDEVAVSVVRRAASCLRMDRGWRVSGP